MPRIPQEILDEILSRVDIVELIASYIPLKKVGRSFKALCPFHNEKTPSFIVSVEKQIYHCFGCSLGGNAFNFLMQYERISFQEAVESLARKASVSLPKTQDNIKESGVVASLYKINELALNYYHEFLINSKEAQAGRDYLKKRKIDAKTVSILKIGFAPNSWQGLLDFLRAKNISLSLIEKCGLIIPRNNGGYYDRFRNRVVFPIFDLKDRPVAFSARVLPVLSQVAGDGSLPKYINSPDTAVFSKGKVLYGLNTAKEELRKIDYVLIVEGNFDFVTLFQAGIQNTVATLGTALTNDHARVIKRFTKNVKVLFDADKAGELAALRSFDIFIEEGLNVEIVALEKGFDPDSYLIQSGIDKLREKLRKSEDFFDYRLRLLKSSFDVKTLKGKAAIAKEMLPSIKKVDSEVLKSEYVKKLAQDLNVEERALMAELKKIKPDYYLSQNILKTDSRSQGLSAEMMLLKLILKDINLIFKLKESINFSDLKDLRVGNIIDKIFNLMNRDGEVSISKIINHFDSAEDVNILSQASLSEEVDFLDKEAKNREVNLEKLFNDCLRKIKEDNLRIKRKNIQEEIKIAQEKNDQSMLKKLLVEFGACMK